MVAHSTRTVQAMGVGDVPLFDVVETIPTTDVSVWYEVVQPANNMGLWGIVLGVGSSALFGGTMGMGLVEGALFFGGIGGGMFSMTTFMVMLSPYRDRCVRTSTHSPTLIDIEEAEAPEMPAFRPHEPMLVAPTPVIPRRPQGKSLLHPEDRFVFFSRELIAQLLDHATDEQGNVVDWYFSRDGVWVNLPAFTEGRSADQQKIAYKEMKECLEHSGLCRPERQRTMWTEAGIKWLKEAV